jgi:hypothetical protein
VINRQTGTREKISGGTVFNIHVKSIPSISEYIVGSIVMLSIAL